MRLRRVSDDKHLLAYVVGLALGDGNLSNPNGRATRLRITCDPKYPELLGRIRRAVADLLPENKVSLVPRPDGAVDVSCFSNHWEQLLGWKARHGSKLTQRARVPEWIKIDREFSKACLRGLIETDGSIYTDRGYRMVMFYAASSELASDFATMVESLGFRARRYMVMNKAGFRPFSVVYRVRIAKKAKDFLAVVGAEKS